MVYTRNVITLLAALACVLLLTNISSALVQSAFDHCNINAQRNGGWEDQDAICPNGFSRVTNPGVCPFGAFQFNVFGPVYGCFFLHGENGCFLGGGGDECCFYMCSDNPPEITNIHTNPQLPIENEGTMQDIAVFFTSNEYPLTVQFQLTRSQGQVVDSTGPLTVTNVSGLPLHYFIPAGLPMGIYTLTMEIHDAENVLNFTVGNIFVTVSRTMPTIEIISPENTTYNSSQIHLNINATNANTTVYQIDQGASINYTGETLLTLNEGSHYIRATAAGTEGVVYDEVYFSVEAGNGDTTPPATVTNLTAHFVNQTAIVWEWINPADDDFLQALIYFEGTNVQNTSNTSIEFENLTPNTPYTITILTQDTRGNINTTPISLTTTTAPSNSSNDTTPPASVTHLFIANREISSLNWSWTNPADTDFAFAMVFLDGVQILNTTTTSYQASNLASDTTHMIALWTVDMSGNINKTNVSNTATTRSDNNNGGGSSSHHGTVRLPDNPPVEEEQTQHIGTSEETISTTKGKKSSVTFNGWNVALLLITIGCLLLLLVLLLMLATRRQRE